MLRVAAPRAAGFVLLIFHVDALAVLRSYENKLLVFCCCSCGSRTRVGRQFLWFVFVIFAVFLFLLDCDYEISLNCGEECHCCVVNEMATGLNGEWSEKRGNERRRVSIIIAAK